MFSYQLIKELIYMKRTYPKELTSISMVKLPDGTCKPVAITYDVGGPNQRRVVQMPKEEWEEYQRQMMINVGKQVSYQYSSQRN